MKLGLRGRLTLAFLLLAGLATAAAGALLVQHARAQFRSDFEERVALARTRVTDRLQRDAAALSDRARALASDPRVEHLLQDLEHGLVDSDPGARKRQVVEARALLSGADVDALWLVDAHVRPVRVLAAPHQASEPSLPVGAKALLSASLGRHVIVTDQVVRAGRGVPAPLLTVGVARRRLRLLVGRVVGQAVAEELKSGGADVEVTIRDSEERVVASTLADPSADAGPAGFETERVGIRNGDDAVAVLLVDVHVSRGPLERRLQGVVRAALTVGGAAAALALLLGWLIARRITRPLEQLVVATRQIADGNRDIELPSGGGDEVGQLVVAFRFMAAALEESEAALKQSERIAAWQDIARELAHEIKNPLTPIQMAIETVRRTHARRHPKFDEVFEESTATILEEVDRLKGIVTEFSQFARLPRPNPHPASLNELVHHAVVLYREAPDVLVEERLDPALPELLLDSDRMTQVVQNLVKNAIQATGAVDRAGRVWVSTRAAPPWAELVVEDNGCGIPSDDLPRVFTPYFTSKAGGTGLGLAVVHRLVTGHSGRISVTSRVGEGTRFVVQLPLAGGPRVESGPA